MLKDEDEAGVCGVQRWKEVGEGGEGEGDERWFTSLEREEQRMEKGVHEEWTDIGMGHGGIKLLLLCCLPEEGKTGRVGKWKMG